MVQKQMLVVRASDDVRSCETDFLKPLGKMLNFSVDPIIDLEADKVKSKLESLEPNKYDYVYMCGHGNKWTLSGTQDKHPVAASWPELSGAVCTSLREEATIVLGCCEGGLRTIAYDFLIACDQLRHIFGLSGSVLETELMLALHVILSGVSDDLVDGHTAASRAGSSIGRRVSHYDGDDLRYSAEFDHYKSYGQQLKYLDFEHLKDDLDADDVARQIVDPLDESVGSAEDLA